jgi:PadR family transcriptional regulator, regulatory protein PadR
MTEVCALVSKPSDMIQGTLDLLILRTISQEPRHGWAIAKRIEQISEEVLQVSQGSLYPALHRLEQQLAQWERLSHAIGLVLRYS